jgi:kinesin family protein 5
MLNKQPATVGASSTGVNVFVRFRPDNETEIQNGTDCVTFYPDETNVSIDANGLVHRFVFRKIFQAETSQEEVFVETSSFLTEKVLEGYNSAVLAYGQTGAGKTYTLLGPGYDNIANITSLIRTQNCLV